MKLLSIAIPCYNSEAYMENCIKSLLPGGDEVEILVIDDGSKDRTAEIADEYQEKYPGIVRAIHQPNLGHGGAVNTGIHNAQGLYFKVVSGPEIRITDIGQFTIPACTSSKPLTVKLFSTGAFAIGNSYLPP